MFALIWAIIFAVGLTFEAYTIIRKRRGDTLSEHVWLLSKYGVGRLLLIPAWVWMTYHFWIEHQISDDLVTHGYDDWSLVALAAVLTFVGNKKKWFRNRPGK